MITLHSNELYRFIAVEFGSKTLPAEVSNSLVVCGDVLTSFMCSGGGTNALVRSMSNCRFCTMCALCTDKFRDYILQIIEADNQEVKVHYYVEDTSRRGYQKEKKAYWIDLDKIKNKLKCPRVEKIGVRKEIFVFDEFK